VKRDCDVWQTILHSTKTEGDRISLELALACGKNKSITHNHWHYLTEALKHIGSTYPIILIGSSKAKTNVGIVFQKHYVTDNHLCTESEKSFYE
jgi:hypothetical protein